jgi:NADP-dependent 3-hydroxy acid dehydrogenase YdfG
MKLTDVKNKIAVITGASSGIGEATARLLVAEGMHTILVARRKDKLDSLAEELGQLAIPFQADVTSQSDMAAVYDYVRTTFGGLDLLINNAGLGIYGEFASSKPQDWATQINANLVGVLNCTHAAIPLMAGREGAMISTVSSVGGRYGYAGWSVYCATKYAVIGFQDSLRKELSDKGIRVSVIEPGAVWTEWGDNVSEELKSNRRTAVDALTAEDVANALFYSFAQPHRVLVGEILIRPLKQTEN